MLAMLFVPARWMMLPQAVRARRSFKPQAPASPVVAKHPPIHKTMSAAVATQKFLEWLAESWDETFLSSSQVDDSWHQFSRARGIYPIYCGLIREEMTARGLCLNLKRLNAPEFLHIKHALGKDRAVVYRRPSKQQLMASPQTAESALPDDSQIVVGYATTRSRHVPGKRTATAKRQPRKRQLPVIPDFDDSYGIAA